MAQSTTNSETFLSLPGRSTCVDLQPEASAPCLGHLAALHRSERSCLQEHQDYCRVSGWWADQRSQGKTQTQLENRYLDTRSLLSVWFCLFTCRVHLTLTLSRRRTSWRELPSPTVNVFFLTNKFSTLSLDVRCTFVSIHHTWIIVHKLHRS